MTVKESWEEDFASWFSFLLLSCARSGKYGMDHPLGSALMRDVVRDKAVRAEMKKSYKKHVIDGEEEEDDE